MPKQLAYILVGDHLGQVKKVLPETGEISVIDGCAQPDSSNPVVSIEPIGFKSKQLIANKNGDLFIYDAIHDKTKACEKARECLNKALPITAKKTLLVYDKQVILDKDEEIVSIKQKKSQIKNAKVNEGQLAIVGIDIPLRIFDVEKKSKTFEADPPEKDYLGIKPDVFVSGLDFVGQSPTRIATCSKSDSVVRIYDTKSKPKPIISANVDQTAFNEYADSSKFICVSSTSDMGNVIVVGSNVGQMLAIDLRFNVKQIPKKKLQPRTHKVLGGFKGARGGSIKDVHIVPNYKADEDGLKVVSCCLDRYLRIHNFTRNLRHLDKHVYMNTKPLCCSPVLYEEP